MQARQGAAIKKWMETGSHFPLCKRISTHHCHLELETQIMSDHHGYLASSVRLSFCLHSIIPTRRCRIPPEWANPSGRVKMKKLTCHQLALLLLLFHFSGTGWGQVTASITGVVRDVSGPSCRERP